MNRTQLLFVLLFFTSSICQSDSNNPANNSDTINNSTIVIDFNKKSINYHIKNKLKSGDFFKLQIDGINSNLYKIELSSRDTILTKPLETPSFGNFKIDELLKSVINIQHDVADVEPLGVLGKISDSSLIIKETVTKAESPENLLNKLDSINISMEKCNSNITNKSKEICNLKYNLLKIRLYSLAADTNIKNDKDIIEFKKDMVSYIQKTIDTIIAINKYLTEQKDKLNDIKTEYLSITELPGNAKIIKTSDKLKSLCIIIDTNFDKITSNYKNVVSSISEEKSYEILTPLIHIDNNKMNNYISLPIQFKDEQTKIKLTITPRDEKSNLQSYSTELVFPKKLRFYASIGVSMYLSTLHDSSYSIIKSKLTDSTNSYKIIKEKNYKCETGFASLLRLGGKIGNSNIFGLNGSMGVGMSVSDDTKPRFLFGGGMTLGEKHVFTLDLGAICGNVERLSSAIDLNTSYSELPDRITVSKLKVGGFCSIGYMYLF